MSTQMATRVARVLIADDQTLFRTGLARLLDEDPRVEVVGQAVDGRTVKEWLAGAPRSTSFAAIRPCTSPCTRRRKR